ncbi:MAG: D-glycero-D-manno-heptose 1-phosphate guanosyltransferase [Flavobacteriales bacterium]|nr:MAG: D-glycero-D-manno-heptose 1-phosphate guanosyltransferase [Flavobacteriales bacterium]
MTSEAIILAGGFGTRLTSVKDVPKPMAPINDVPFLQILLDDLLVKGITKFYLAVGHQHEVIVDYFGSSYMGCKIHYVIEDSPLGTGGAIKQALEQVASENVFVFNGDTFFDVDIELMDEQHQSKKSDVTLALKPLTDFDRYGAVEHNDELRITNFSEKKFCKEGVINGGIYLLQTNIFDGLDFPKQFSMEQDYFEKYCSKNNLSGFIDDGYFIDIGIPEDYEKAQEELQSF